MTKIASSAGEKDLCNDTQIRVICSVEPEIRMEILGNLTEKFRAKFPVTTCGYSMVKFSCLDNAFSEFFELEASPVEGQSQQQEDKKRRKKNERCKKKIERSLSHPKKAKKSFCHVANTFLSRPELILISWPTSKPFDLADMGRRRVAVTLYQICCLSSVI